MTTAISAGEASPLGTRPGSASVGPLDQWSYASPSAKRHHNLPAHRIRLIGPRASSGRKRRVIGHRRPASSADGNGRLRQDPPCPGIGLRRFPAFPDGVGLVELAAVADPALVPRAIVSALGVRERPGEPLTTTLDRALSKREFLPVLGNCEHVMPR
jgi:hypothetical protein